MAAVSQLRRVLGGQIRLHRTRKELSQDELAELADLHPKYFSEVERGNKNISVDSLARIAAALRVPLEELVRGT